MYYCKDTATTEIYTNVHTLSRHDALPIYDSKTCGTYTSDRQAVTIGKASAAQSTSPAKPQPARNNCNCTWVAKPGNSAGLLAHGRRNRQPWPKTRPISGAACICSCASSAAMGALANRRSVPRGI